MGRDNIGVLTCRVTTGSRGAVRLWRRRAHAKPILGLYFVFAKTKLTLIYYGIP